MYKQLDSLLMCFIIRLNYVVEIIVVSRGDLHCQCNISFYTKDMTSVTGAAVYAMFTHGAVFVNVCSVTAEPSIMYIVALSYAVDWCVTIAVTKTIIYSMNKTIWC